jgi:hypothetical protein
MLSALIKERPESTDSTSFNRNKRMALHLMKAPGNIRLCENLMAEENTEKFQPRKPVTRHVLNEIHPSTSVVRSRSILLEH